MGHGNIGHGRGLTRDEAEARARLLSDVRYQVEVDLTGPSSELFGSVATVRFAGAEPGRRGVPRGHQAGLRLLPADLRLPLRVREVRPGAGARDGWRHGACGLRHLQ